MKDNQAMVRTSDSEMAKRRHRGWTTDQMPRMDGSVVVVTGANSGIGFEAARAFALAGARVVFACRTESKALDALRRVREEQAEASVEFMQLDLSSLASIAEFAAEFTERFDRLDRLVNNAGVMVPPYQKTEDGFELQFGTNHLGHFALTGRLLPMLLNTDGARVVNVSSVGHRLGKINLDDPNYERRQYVAWLAYGQSKLANLLFTYELQRRFEAADVAVVATAAHPGWTATNLQRNTIFGALNSLLAQTPEEGAWPTLAAAVAEADGGEYYGPNGFLEATGPARLVGSNRRARDEETAARLWALSEELTGVIYDFERRALAHVA